MHVHGRRSCFGRRRCARYRHRKKCHGPAEGRHIVGRLEWSAKGPLPHHGPAARSRKLSRVPGCLRSAPCGGPGRAQPWLGGGRRL